MSEGRLKWPLQTTFPAYLICTLETRKLVTERAVDFLECHYIDIYDKKGRREDFGFLDFFLM